MAEIKQRLGCCPEGMCIDFVWEKIETAPKDRDFLVALANGYVTRARFVMGKFFAADSFGDGKGDPTPTHWMEIPLVPSKAT